MRTSSNKMCTKCKHIKPNSYFYNDAGTGDGLTWWCKSCKCAYDKDRHKHKIDIGALMRTWGRT